MAEFSKHCGVLDKYVELLARLTDTVASHVLKLCGGTETQLPLGALANLAASAFRASGQVLPGGKSAASFSNVKPSEVVAFYEVARRLL